MEFDQFELELRFLFGPSTRLKMENGLELLTKRRKKTMLKELKFGKECHKHVYGLSSIPRSNPPYCE